MADHEDHSEKKEETLIEKITEKFGGGDSSSSSDSDSEKKKKPASSSPSSVKDKIFRLFGRERPVHQVFGGGKRRFPSANFLHFLSIVYIYFFMI